MITNKVNFTAGRVDSFECEKGKQQSFYWDAKTPSLGIRVTATGKKTYIFESRVGGSSSPIRLKIGDTRTYTIGAAQKEANRLKALTDQGIDPRELAKAKEEQAQAKRSEAKSKELLVGEAWNEYLKYQKDKMTRPHIERGKKWGARHLKDHENLSQAGGEQRMRSKEKTKPGVLYPLMSMRMANISADVLRNWQKIEAATRANNARQGFEMFRAFWRWCAIRPEYSKIIDVNAVEGKELRDEVPSRKSKRFDVLQRAQLKPWFKAVNSLRSLVAKAYLQSVILTGARREEMANLKWVDVDFQWNVLWLKDKVEEQGRKIPLTPYLKSLIEGLPRRNEWVFSSPLSRDGRYADPSVSHHRALELAELPPVTIHGLRRTFASLAEWVEMPVGVVAEIKGHKPSATAEKHYISRPIELLAIWHTKYEAWILEQAGVEFRPQEDVQALRLVGGSVI
ncbi:MULTISPECIES: integrase family protein [unclassified Polynucleobacter]|uniref:tyrosine-type recombinase/integrase n=1 Tax=unclassified Polynucleobacter TaxID=2640945 RepID=UPI000BD884E9|nr:MULTISPECIES: integrase family protein [unclassified Polynucleobacter]OYY14566.1 MAG: preprotein translocase [Polynucleobacter sp. 35-46-11]OZA75404.1 MAG: preprotein translocase [Polynucleobacter sp. 39-46-10]